MAYEDLTGALQAAKAGDEQAFRKLFDVFWDMVCYHCKKYLGNTHDAEDAAQEVFLVLYRRINGIEHPKYLKHRIMRIVTEVCGNHGRGRKSDMLDNSFLLDSVDDGQLAVEDEFLPEAIFENKDTFERLLNLVQELPQKQRQVIVLRYYDELSLKEIAAVTGAKEKAVDGRLRIARDTLRTKLRAGQKGEGMMFGYIPVLTRILRADFERTRFAPEVKQQIFRSIRRTYLQDSVKGQPGTGAAAQGAGFKAAVAVLCAVAVAGAVAGGIQLYRQSKAGTQAASMLPPDTAQNMLAGLGEIKTQAQLESFARLHGFGKLRKMMVEPGDIYSITHKALDNSTVLIGGVEAADGGFILAWQVADSDVAPPADDAVQDWVWANLKGVTTVETLAEDHAR